MAIKYTDKPYELNQSIDIYDKNYNKTAENIEYALYDNSIDSICRLSRYSISRQPNGYFPIWVKIDKYKFAYGIIDYTGEIIVRPVFREIKLCTYEEMGKFS